MAVGGLKVAVRTRARTRAMVLGGGWGGGSWYPRGASEAFLDTWCHHVEHATHDTWGCRSRLQV